MSSAADGDALGTDCGLEDASLHPALAQESTSGADNQAQFLGVPIPASPSGQPFPRTSALFHPWTPR